MSKYDVEIKGKTVDVYDVLSAFEVKCPAVQHAVKKLLMPGKRGHKTELDDLKEARVSINRAITLADERAFREKAAQAFVATLTGPPMQTCDDFPVGYYPPLEKPKTDRELRDEMIASTVDDGRPQPYRIAPKMGICCQCGYATADGVCQAKGCGFNTLAGNDSD